MANAIRWSQAQLDAYHASRQRMVADNARELMAADQPRVIAAAVQDKVVNQSPGPRFRSTWEERFADQLVLLQREGSILWWGYEVLTLFLPGGVRYRVDFTTLKAEGGMACFEVKGRVREPARIKLRAAIALHPRFEWYLVGGDMTPRRLYTPGDVPATTRRRKGE